VKNIILVILFFVFSLSLSAQKMYFTYCKLLDNDGNIVKLYKGEFFVHWYSEFITVSSTDPEVLKLISPSTIDDPSNFRVYVQIEKTIYVPRRGGGYYRKTIFQDIESNFRFDILAANSSSFFMFALNPSMALVMDNVRKKPKKKRK
jgi:hypothetical protein|tara:strand:+ start:70 stop:510 length:441 start_codon:yes stop_codon:yes gene_type:complete